MKVFEQLLHAKKERGAAYLVLIDPDKQSVEDAVKLAKMCEKAGVDALLVGGSLLFAHIFGELIKAIKAACDLPVIIFPGGARQISPYADAILFLSLISGRNPHHLIGEQVISAPIIKSMKLETISTGYMFIEAGNVTSAQFLSDSRPIPRKKTDIALAHALAAEYLGMRCIYLEAGSGAKLSVPEEMIGLLYQHVTIPMIVGGGIRTPEEALRKVEAGASFVVTGNVVEKNPELGFLKAFADAIHEKKKR
ncbi:geranylgeranylglyceryl/heptaprenylglyceryl phosphate synthase [candidate division KSB1 bacterium]|nr:geranylgeranylglyceryl/heptaprenylglyceryl phosphate synthase [candidate division KSB1 bacterium]